MPSTKLTIRVSRREADRPRLLQVNTYDIAGAPRGSVALTITVDDNGTLTDESSAPSRQRHVDTPEDGIVLFQWYEWPRNGPPRDFTSLVTVSWKDAATAVYLENLFE